MDLRSGGRAVVTTLVVLTAAGCVPAPPDATASPATNPTVTTAPTVATTPPAVATTGPLVVPTAELVHGAGTPLDPHAPEAGALLAVDGADVRVAVVADGSARAALVGPAGALAWVAPPPGGRAEPQVDGSVTLLDAGGAVVAALDAPVGTDGSRSLWRPQGDVLALDAPTGSASFVVGTAAVASATWGQADGGTSLLVVPADWVRGGSLAGQHALASQLGVAEPEAASGSMQAQLWCHVLGATGKDSWNLEPWRPEVPTATMLVTGCNPTDADL